MGVRVSYLLASFSRVQLAVLHEVLNGAWHVAIVGVQKEHWRVPGYQLLQQLRLDTSEGHQRLREAARSQSRSPKLPCRQGYCLPA